MERTCEIGHIDQLYMFEPAGRRLKLLANGDAS
jgi:hypothetical protein